MSRIALCSLFALTACGNITPLVRPADIPAYEQKREEKRKEYAPYDKDGRAIDPEEKP